MKKISKLLIIGFLLSFACQTYPKRIPDEFATSVIGTIQLAAGVGGCLTATALAGCGYCLSKANSDTLKEFADVPLLASRVVGVPSLLLLGYSLYFINKYWKYPRRENSK